MYVAHVPHYVSSSRLSGLIQQNVKMTEDTRRPMILSINHTIVPLLVRRVDIFPM